MAQYFTDWSEFAINDNPPAGWTLDPTANNSGKIVAGGSAQMLEHNPTVSSYTSVILGALSVSGVTTIINHHDALGSSSRSAGTGFCLSGTSGYVLLRSSNNSILMRRIDSGASTTLDSSAITANSGFVETIVKFTPSTGRIEVACHPVGGSVTWLLDVTDTTYGSGSIGLVGVTNRIGNSDLYAVGTDGDPAPTGPVGGARRRSPLLLTPW